MKQKMKKSFVEARAVSDVCDERANYIKRSYCRDQAATVKLVNTLKEYTAGLLQQARERQAEVRLSRFFQRHTTLGIYFHRILRYNKMVKFRILRITNFILSSERQIHATAQRKAFARWCEKINVWKAFENVITRYFRSNKMFLLRRAMAAWLRQAVSLSLQEIQSIHQTKLISVVKMVNDIECHRTNIRRLMEREYYAIRLLCTAFGAWRRAIDRWKFNKHFHASMHLVANSKRLALLRRCIRNYVRHAVTVAMAQWKMAMAVQILMKECVRSNREAAEAKIVYEESCSKMAQESMKLRIHVKNILRTNLNSSKQLALVSTLHLQEQSRAFKETRLSDKHDHIIRISGIKCRQRLHSKLHRSFFAWNRCLWKCRHMRQWVLNMLGKKVQRKMSQAFHLLAQHSLKIRLLRKRSVNDLIDDICITTSHSQNTYAPARMWSFSPARPTASSSIDKRINKRNNKPGK